MTLPRASEQMVPGASGQYWTAASVPMSGRPSLFLSARSWADSDDSGLPDWWQLQYFGHLGVDPYADPDNDGWNNLQEFQNNTSPTNFNTRHRLGLPAPFWIPQARTFVS